MLEPARPGGCGVAEEGEHLLLPAGLAEGDWAILICLPEAAGCSWALLISGELQVMTRSQNRGPPVLGAVPVLLESFRPSVAS